MEYHLPKKLNAGRFPICAGSWVLYFRIPVADRPDSSKEPGVCTESTGWKKKAEIRDRIEDVLQQVGMQTKGYKMPHELFRSENSSA